MSKESQLNALKKEELVQKLVEADLREKELLKNSDVKVAEKDVQASSDSVSMLEILEQNRNLREQLDRKKQTDKFVFLECQSKGRVWLPAPESRSGALEDREKGRMLKGDKDFAVVPAYWMIDFISRRTESLVRGDIVINNSRGRELNPNIEFVDFDLPNDFFISGVKNIEIENIVKKGDNTIYEFVKKHKNNVALLGRSKGVVDAVTAQEENKPEGKRNDALISFLTGVSIHIDEILSPNKEAEFTEAKKREEILLKTV